MQRPTHYPTVDDVINFVQAKLHSRRGRMVSSGLVLVAAGAVAVAPSLMHSNSRPTRQAVVPQTSPISISLVPAEAPPTPTTLDVQPLVVDPLPGSRLGGLLPQPTTTSVAPRVVATPATAPPATAPPATAPPATAPPVTAPPATAAPPLTLPADGPITVP